PGSGYRGPGAPREERPGSGYRGPAAYHNAPLSGSIAGGIGQRHRLPVEGPSNRGPRMNDQRPGRSQNGKAGGRPVGQGKPRPATPPRPKREKIPPPAPFSPTPEQVAQVEARYIELAVPSEFDGI